MPRVERTLQQIAEANDTRMGYLLQELRACFDQKRSLDSYTYMYKMCFLRDMIDQVSECAREEHDRIIAIMSSVNSDVWRAELAEHNRYYRMYGDAKDYVWCDTPHMDCLMDDEAYDAKDALAHIQIVQRIYCDGPEAYEAVRQTAAIGHHDTMYFTDMPRATLHDLENQVWYDSIDSDNEYNRLILEKHIFTDLMDHLRGNGDERFTRILLNSSNKDMEAFIELLRKSVY